MAAPTGRRWVISTAVSGTVGIAAGAFWLSFTSLTDLARRSGIEAGQAWAWPLIVDGLIVVATVAVVALAGQRTAWYPWTLLIGAAVVSVAANAIHAIVAADADVPALLAASVAAVPPVVLLAITHLTVILTRTTETTHPAETAETAEPAADPAVSSDAVSFDAVSFDAAIPAPAATEPAEVSLIAEHDIAALGVRDRRELAAGLRDQGMSNKAIARHLGVHPSTVGRWFASAHQTPTPDSAFEDEETTDEYQR